MRGYDPLLPVLGHLTDRDSHLLELLHDHKVLTTAQIATAPFPTSTSPRRDLSRFLEPDR